jgi:hypothetical protein
MSSKTLRLTGFLFLVAATILAVLNLKSVADMGTLWVSIPLLMIGIVLIAIAGKRK